MSHITLIHVSAVAAVGMHAHIASSMPQDRGILTIKSFTLARHDEENENYTKKSGKHTINDRFDAQFSLSLRSEAGFLTDCWNLVIDRITTQLIRFSRFLGRLDRAPRKNRPNGPMRSDCISRRPAHLNQLAHQWSMCRVQLLVGVSY